MKAILMVFLGGGLGSILRYLVYRMTTHLNFKFPFATLTVNILGSLLLGFILGYTFRNLQLSGNTILFLTTGFCGGFTTFSTFAYENQALLKSGDYLNFAIYSFGSLLLGILAVILGLHLSKLS